MVTAVKKHDTVCARGMATQKARRTKFLNRYPNYCKTCQATGWRSYQDWEGYWDVADCHDCLEKDLCPRCMKKTLVEEKPYRNSPYTFPACSTCGWRNNDDYGDRYCLPDEPVCVCEQWRLTPNQD